VFLCAFFRALLFEIARIATLKKIAEVASESARISDAFRVFSRRVAQPLHRKKGPAGSYPNAAMFR
jgi:hypothetical protein